jgi:hypothetical protein
MAKLKTKRTGAPAPAAPKPFEEARNELFQHIMRCEVSEATPEHQAEWFDETMKYMEERYTELREADFVELRKLGLRFTQPPKSKQTDESGAATAA